MATIETTKKKTQQLVAAIKTRGEDFEWYPTTSSMLTAIRRDMESVCIHHNSEPAMLDIGAGDGRTLQHLTKGSRYAIEKCQTLIQAMDNSVFIVGTEFNEQTLIDKCVDVVFCNPPYSDYETWCEKILLEANCQYIYLIVPRRWASSTRIAHAVSRREAKTEVIHSCDFLDAERQARANVDIIRVELAYSGHSSSARVDPFDVWFDDEFQLDIHNKNPSKYDWSQLEHERQREAINSALVNGRDIIGVLHELYINELTHLMSNYKAIEQLDGVVLKELNVDIVSLKSALKMRVEGLKDRYWKELFDNMSSITSRLTTSARERMMGKLMKHTHVDFTVSNAHALLIWVIKHANSYYNSQLISLVETLTENTSIVLYKSNERVFTNEDWKYRRTPEGLERYGLDYRIVLSRLGGLHRSEWQYERDRFKGLSESAFTCLSDILTVANNLGFDTSQSQTPRSFVWESNKAVDFTYAESPIGESHILMSVRCFYNGNCHIRFSQAFIKRLNVEFGRLRGWLKDANTAGEELNVDAADAEISFGSNKQIEGTALKMLNSRN